MLHDIINILNILPLLLHPDGWSLGAYLFLYTASLFIIRTYYWGNAVAESGSCVSVETTWEMLYCLHRPLLWLWQQGEVRLFRESTWAQPLSVVPSPPVPPAMEQLHWGRQHVHLSRVLSVSITDLMSMNLSTWLHTLVGWRVNSAMLSWQMSV